LVSSVVLPGVSVVLLGDHITSGVVDTTYLVPVVKGKVVGLAANIHFIQVKTKEKATR